MYQQFIFGIIDLLLANSIFMITKMCCGGSNGAVYGLGFIGAVIYFLSNATTFGMGVIGFLKAIVWPGFLVFELLKLVGA